MPQAGTATINFGAFPGKSDAEVTVSGQTGILSNSIGEAFLMAKASADHSSDEHMLESIKVFFDHDTIVAGASFKIKAFNTSEINEPLDQVEVNQTKPLAAQPLAATWPSRGGAGTRIYGAWNVGWAGNWTN